MALSRVAARAVESGPDGENLAPGASFVAFAEHAGAGTITTELALSWATQPQQASPIWLAHRLSAVRGFARYLHALDPAARQLTPPLQAATFETLLGLLAVTGRTSLLRPAAR
jgi:hypothetical protein